MLAKAVTTTASPIAIFATLMAAIACLDMAYPRYDTDVAKDLERNVIVFSCGS
jgi:hypothetical protein